MKIVYKGRRKNIDDMPKSNLPSGAVKFREPDSMLKLNFQAAVLMIISLIIILLFILIVNMLKEDVTFYSFGYFWLIGFGIAFILLISHVFFMRLAYGKDVTFDIYFISGTFIIYCEEPMSKIRFILSNILESLVFGWLPLIIVTVFVFPRNVSLFLFGMSISTILLSCGTYLNAYNALRQMPKGSMHQLSGFSSYWFMPEDNR